MNKEDITRRTKELYTYDCVLDKKRLRCVEHDCVLKVVNMSYQSGSGLKGKSNLDMLLRSSRGIRNSRILVSVKSNRWCLIVLIMKRGLQCIVKKEMIFLEWWV